MVSSLNSMLQGLANIRSFIKDIDRKTIILT